ncbi:amidase [Mariniluteicoccus endophyticus]
MEHFASTALALADLIRRREVSVTEVTDRALEAARADQLGAFVHVADERARTQARELDARLADPDFTPGPLFGVACPIKDLNSVKGVPYEAGSAALRGNVGTWDDGTVTLLREAGTVMLGKTATPEFGLPCYTEPEGHRPASTPFDPSRGAGGSSGGAAVAVASGIVPIAHGSDGGGSIRIPASACGLVGMKPSRGRVSPGPHLGDGPGLATQGVLTRDVRDTAAALDVLSRRWPGDTYLAPYESFLTGLDAPTPRLRVGVLRRGLVDPDALVHPAALRAVDVTLNRLAARGHEIVDVPDCADLAEQWQAFQCMWAVLALGAPVPEPMEDRLRPLSRWLRELGRGVSGQAYAEAVFTQQRLSRAYANAWDPVCDVLVMPTLAQPPAAHGSLRDDDDPAADFAAQTRFTPWTSVFNLTGRPAISLPLHREVVDGVELPFGVMIAAQPLRDALLLGLGLDLEED